MSSSRALFTVSRAFALRAPLATRRTFATTTQLRLKEGSQQDQNHEHHKQDQLAKQSQGKNHWKPELASNSEEAVKADKHAAGETPEELQKKTAGHAEETAKKGTSDKDPHA